MVGLPTSVKDNLVEDKACTIFREVRPEGDAEACFQMKMQNHS